ncbi:MAG TPA: capsular biosynthesis protein [Candidatus Omnitrophota bacterium]|nr:capsular biosynthesis protein [Candidatus Omnitrophota bacterium]
MSAALEKKQDAESKMKIGLILPANIWGCPYTNIYTEILKENKVDFDLISWNRDGSENNTGLQFEKQLCRKNRYSKLIPYLSYISFIKKIIRKNKYNKLIIHGSQIAILLSSFLRKHYNKRYIFDYRDITIDQLWYFKRNLHAVLRGSFVNIISSPGFKKHLPNSYEYFSSHNFNVEEARQALTTKTNNTKSDIIRVLTIGTIRDYVSNVEVIKALANKQGYLLQFVGKGVAQPLIEQYVKINNVRNIELEGYYPKKNEAKYITGSTILNIFLPKTSHRCSAALANRFYHGLIHKKPMIVTAHSTHSEFIVKNQLGLALDDCANLDKKIKNFLQSLDQNKFSDRCNSLLRTFIEDYQLFKSIVVSFIKT